MNKLTPVMILLTLKMNTQQTPGIYRQPDSTGQLNPLQTLCFSMMTVLLLFFKRTGTTEGTAACDFFQKKTCLKAGLD